MLHAGDMRAVSTRSGQAHGGQGAVAGMMRRQAQVGAILRASDGVIRVWNGVAGKREEFSLIEARALCDYADELLTTPRFGGTVIMTFLEDGCRSLKTEIVAREWLIAFCAAVRRELRKADAAGARS